MNSLYPFTFKPIFKERVWGGRRIETLFKKSLPPDAPIGESWEITDRAEDVSEIANGPLAGKTLRWLMENHADEVFGKSRPGQKSFPLLVKILDCTDKLSLQVHPPASKTKELGGEPKTEMWVFVDATPQADIFVGLKRGVTREEFERKTRDGTVAECFHRIPVASGDVMFLPSGRVHALGAGGVVFEIQQNSDTTYRVFDWNRVGLDGKPRELHIPQSMTSIDFNDFEPPLVRSEFSRNEEISIRYLVDDPLFRVNQWRVKRDARFYLKSELPQILGVMSGEIVVRHNDHELKLAPGSFSLLPASLDRVTITAPKKAEFLHVEF
jgi:mannose-6-phosphate isomerase